MSSAYLHVLDINAQDQDGDTALHYAVKEIQADDVRENITRSQFLEMAKLIASSPMIDIHLADNDGKTALDIAKEGKKSDFLDILVAKRWKLRYPKRRSKLALWASSSGEKRIYARM